MIEAHRYPLELWGGIECTIARIGDKYRDQLEETGHAYRLSDIALIARLGVKKVRFPVLWEAIASGKRNWEWHDQRLTALRAHGIEPILGLLHHGSGPIGTNLLDPNFPHLFADFAEQVAQRYPWARYFTPINEPLTTARFSALYGHWYPHHRNQQSFIQALVNQCYATMLAMRRIRRIIPDGALVQTEDMGKTFSTRRLAYQAEYENERRWLSFDLLFGRLNQTHRWYKKVAPLVDKRQLVELASGEAAPDIIGINHYLTSERFLDHRLALYPQHHQGGNGRHRYADIEAVRLDLPPDDIGPKARLRDTWSRYLRPIAVTEIHHGCTREEQVRWLVEVARGTEELRQQGVDIRAITLWSLFGAVDWNSLLTQRIGFYEPGAFDIRGPKIRPTLLAHAFKAMNRSEAQWFEHPILDIPGWWHRAERRYASKRRKTTRKIIAQRPRRILITGARGTLGSAFARICEARGLPAVILGRQEMDIADWPSVKAILSEMQPWAIINTAGYVRVLEAEQNADRCRRENVDGAKFLALGAAELGIPYMTFSSDLIFDGRLGRPYIETDRPNPNSTYGKSKAEAERLVRAVHPRSLIIRTSAFFGPWDRYNFIYLAMKALEERRPFRASATNIISPTYVPDLVHHCLDLLIDGERGILHLANRGAISWYQLAYVIARALRLNEQLLQRIEKERLNNALDSARSHVMPTLEEALIRCFKESPHFPDDIPERLFYEAAE